MPLATCGSSAFKDSFLRSCLYRYPLIRLPRRPVLTRDGYCIREIKTKTVTAKGTFNRKISLLTSKLNIELSKKLVRYYVWSIALYGSETWTLKQFEYLESFEMWCWRKMEKIKWSEKVTNE